MTHTASDMDTSDITITLMVFSILRETLGFKKKTLTLSEGATVDELLDRMSQEHPVFEDYRSSVRIALNCHYVEGDTVISDGSEIALITPVSGG